MDKATSNCLVDIHTNFYSKMQDDVNILGEFNNCLFVVKNDTILLHYSFSNLISCFVLSCFFKCSFKSSLDHQAKNGLASLPRESISAKVSTNGDPNVSGNKSVKNPPIMAQLPMRMSGNASNVTEGR